MLLLWVLILGHCSIPLCLSQNSNRRGQAGLPRWRPKKSGGGRERGRTQVLAPGGGLGMTVLSGFGALKKDDAYNQGLCCPPESGLRVRKRVALIRATPLITQLCHLGYRERDLENPKL